MQSNISAAGDTESEVDIDALRAEVDKWQERVPKLAAALRERTDELAAARDEIRNLQQNESTEAASTEDVDARLKTRDSHIGELEAKLGELNASFQKTSGELHSAELACSSAQEDSEKWKRKWQELNEALDLEASRSSNLDRERTQLQNKYEAESKEQKATFGEQLAHHEEDKQAMQRRNEQLLESMEMANKQIAALGEDLSQLVAKVESGKQEHAALLEQLQELETTQDQQASKLESVSEELTQARSTAAEREDGLQIELGELQEKLDSVLQEQAQDEAEWNAKLAANTEQVTTAKVELEAAAEAHHAQLEAEKSAAEQARDELNAATERSVAAEAELASMRAESQANQEEVARLEQCVVDASASLPRAEKEREYLQQQISERDEQISKLKSNLAERSAIVMELEQEQHKRDARSEERGADLDNLQRDLATAQNRVTTFQQHNETLETRIQEQRSLIEDLEKDLSEEQQKAAQAKKTLDVQTRAQRNVADASEQALVAERDNFAIQQQEFEALQEQLARNEEELAEAQQELTTKTTELNDAQSSVAEHAAVTSQLADIKTELAETTDKLRSFEQQHADLEAQQSQLSALVDEKEALVKQSKAELIAVRAESVDGAEAQQLRDQLREVETRLRDRTQELDDLRWRESQAQAEAKSNNSESTVMVLNQQLIDARNEIERLKESFKEAQQTSDDLTRLHGVGEKLAEQLQDLGFSTFAQIAALKEADLESETHDLHHLKTRIVRDEWIDQAKSLK